ncbi:15-hydroxyprostaglandin dehydrogenase [NAD(+)]-like [Danaus plexippus]|uniref:15-hydroxyprostaglandin dehydrogenase [NAD(+)]-like n=1 Tax=Danaus plexippus TaxID=13037 RepID=UPI002AB059F1|nr:15-hydroxyprostaglandin dehydrogenase [NAD(+)]-like [Danaus plexippus]
MLFDLKNRVVLITGGCNGIGAKVIEFLLDEDVKHIANLDVSEDIGIAKQDKLNEKYGENKVKFYKCDVTNDAELLGAYQSVLDEHGYIDVVINNAGIMNDSKETYRKQIQINFLALTTSTLKAMDIMRKDEGGKGGVIVNISSIAALLQDEFLPIYYGTKSAVLQFSNCIGLPRYFSRTGVRVLTMCFGATNTALLHKDMMGNFDKVIENEMMDILSKHPMQKVESAALCMIEVLKRGKSGSTWLSIADKPAQDITPEVKKAYGILTELIF